VSFDAEVVDVGVSSAAKENAERSRNYAAPLMVALASFRSTGEPRSYEVVATPHRGVVEEVSSSQWRPGSVGSC
jgi:hypothetical protein